MSIEIAVLPVGRITFEEVDQLDVVVPSPSIPCQLLPQQLTLPSPSNAHVEFPPATIWAIVDPTGVTLTEAGELSLTRETVPSWPASLLPQHIASPSESRVHEWEYPETIETGTEPWGSGTTSGVRSS